MFETAIYAMVTLLSIIAVVNATIGLIAWRRYKQLDPQEKELADFEHELQIWDGRVPTGIVEDDDGQS